VSASEDSAGGERALLTDLYQLTMLQSYQRLGMTEPATFELFVRHLPPARRFLISCGLDAAIDYLASLRFSGDDIAFLRSLGRFDDGFLDALGNLRFTGEVWAIPEGEAFFAGEPVLRVTAPLPEAQLVETFLLTTVLYATNVASKAARCVIAAEERDVIDFSLRRDHGPGAAMTAARSAWIAGAAGTSNVLAGKHFGIPLVGTMAHSYVMAFDDERDAFRAYAEEYPDAAVLLVDTYDTEEGIRRAIEVGRDLANRGHALRGIRLDSGDLSALAVTARRMLDDAGLDGVRIFASGDLNEYRIAEIVRAGAPVDAFGVGTELGVVADAPVLAGVYKLVEYAGRGRAKRSPEKGSLGGRKQVWRRDGFSDVIAREGVTIDGARPLQERAMRDGAMVGSPTLDDARKRCAETLAHLPEELRDLSPPTGERTPEIDASLR
jgi:nicotinate phosphoribosyltransferase